MAGKQARAQAGRRTGARSRTGRDAIRNVVLVGPAGSGQDDPGRDPPGLGRCAEPGGLDRRRHHGLRLRRGRACASSGRSGLALAPLVHDGVKINLLDTPGYADFVGELRAGLRAADCALFVVAANEGVDEPTRPLWRECAEVGHAAGRGGHQARPRPRRLRRGGRARRGRRSATRWCRSTCARATGSSGCSPATTTPTTSSAARSSRRSSRSPRTRR